MEQVILITELSTQLGSRNVSASQADERQLKSSEIYSTTDARRIDPIMPMPQSGQGEKGSDVA